MMRIKTKTVYICENCFYEYTKGSEFISKCGNCKKELCDNCCFGYIKDNRYCENCFI